MVDIISEGFDLAIRGHRSALTDSSLIQHHQALSLSRLTTKGWTLDCGNGSFERVSFVPRLRLNNLVSLKRATCAHLGVSALPHYICRKGIANGALVSVLPGWTVMDAAFSTVIPARKGVRLAVRALLNFLAAELPAALTGAGRRAEATDA